MNTSHKIIIGDSRRMDEVPDGSVHLIVTSPPYWQLKDYGYKGQIGFDDSYEDYINNLNLVWRECERVLHPGCRLAVNVGDQFARSAYYGRYKVIPIRTEIIRFCETAGLDYMGAVIWQKKTTMNTTGGASVMGSYPYPRNGIVEIDYEFVLLFKKPGDAPRVDKAVKESARLTKDEWKEYFSGHWNFGGVRQSGHMAMFPEELPKRLIRMFTFPGEVVLDPFMGSGTTALAARRLGRSSIGYEADDSLEEVFRKKVGKTLEVSRQEDAGIDWSVEVNTLPYRFADPHAVRRREESAGNRYGSKVGYADANAKKEPVRVSEVVSPEIVRLTNGEQVRLIGVRALPRKSRKAVEFIRLKTAGQKVYLKYDGARKDGDGNIRAYVYLKNRTFVNAHLIKYGLAGVDESEEFRRKRSFVEYANGQGRRDALTQ